MTRSIASTLLCSLSLAAALLYSAQARADSFAAGSLIIPMDVTDQDMGMLEAYGLVYALLKAGVPVRWVIKGGKAMGDVDFSCGRSGTWGRPRAASCR